MNSAQTKLHEPIAMVEICQCGDEWTVDHWADNEGAVCRTLNEAMRFANRYFPGDNVRLITEYPIEKKVYLSSEVSAIVRAMRPVRFK